VNTICEACIFHAQGFDTCDFDIVSKYLSGERAPKECPTKLRSLKNSNGTNGSHPKFIHPSRLARENKPCVKTPKGD